MRVLRYIFLTTIIISLAQCSPNKNITSADQKAEDTHELIIFDTNFNTWLVSQSSIDMYSYAFLKSKNTMFVAEYNNRVINRRKYGMDLYPQSIDFNPNVEYDKDFQFKLYNYFIYFQQKYNQRL